MFDPFAIKKLVSNSNSDTSNEIGFRESSTSVASSEAINKGSILPDINIYDNKFSKKESCTTNPKSCTEGCTIKFPIVNVKSHNSARIEDAENCHGMLFNKMDGRTTSQKSSLEESLKKSLENYCHPKFYLEGIYN